MYELTVEGTFSAAHKLRGYKGECENLHGHNWKVEATFRSSGLDNLGMVIDFKELKTLLKQVLKELDHNYLNEIAVFGKENPTTENLARFLYKKIKDEIKEKEVRVYKVRVWESEGASASFIDDSPESKN